MRLTHNLKEFLIIMIINLSKKKELYKHFFAHHLHIFIIITRTPLFNCLVALCSRHLAVKTLQRFLCKIFLPSMCMNSSLFIMLMIAYKFD